MSHRTQGYCGIPCRVRAAVICDEPSPPQGHAGRQAVPKGPGTGSDDGRAQSRCLRWRIVRPLAVDALRQIHVKSHLNSHLVILLEAMGCPMSRYQAKPRWHDDKTIIIVLTFLPPGAEEGQPRH